MSTIHSRSSGKGMLSLLTAILFAVVTTAASAQQAIDADTPLASVNGQVITVGEFADTLRYQGRQTYWHSGVPEAERAGFEREVLQGMIDRILLVEEAGRRELAIDEDAVEGRLEELDARYFGREGWEDVRDEVLAEARELYTADALVELIEAETRAVPAPAEAEVRDYYATHPEKFTEPVKVRLSVILLKVDPSSGNEVWRAAIERAEGLKGALAEGGDFAQVAREYSDDSSAADGGDMGYRHAGTVGEEVDAAVAEMAVGDISKPLVLLDGVALVRLADRTEPTLHEFEIVAERARALLERDLADAAWDDLLTRLRSAADIERDETLLTPEPELQEGS